MSPLPSTSLDQPELERLLRARLAVSGVVGGSVAELQEQLAARTADPQRLLVAVVIRRFELASFVRGTLSFVASLNEQQRADWHREFTRTLFLVGAPGRLCERFTFQHLSETDDVGWTAPQPASAVLPLVRLLKPLRSAAPVSPWPPQLLSGSAGSNARDLTLASVGLRLEEILIHLNHLLADLAIEGQLQAHDALRLRSVSRIERVEAGAFVRVARDPSGAALAAYAALEPAPHPRERGLGASQSARTP